MKSCLTIFISLLIFGSCQQTTCNNWHIGLKTDKNGQVLEGSKEHLIKALRSGADLKVGWGWKYKDKSLEHIAEPSWIGILNEKEVYVYLDPQVLSGLSWEDLTANFADSSLVSQEWRVAINSNGSFDAVWIDRNNHEVTRRLPQNHTMTWWVNQPVNEDVKPYFLESNP